MKIESASFEFGAQTLESLPKPTLPEVAFIGRSNVGKSSLVNRLTGQKDLARTSNTPGRTQQLNFFNIQFRSTSHGLKPLFLVDLPGFGYAKLSLDRREEISAMTAEYLRSRESLSVVCLLSDVRRLPGSDELAVRDLSYNSGRALIVIVTKADTLSNNQRAKQLQLIAKAYGLESNDLVVSGEKIPTFPIWQRILAVI